ncbi:MAG: bifunctional (p)ppGpp synthetase/guanosine-3',5'-bis(diphosphate) 3'-pyrophosphohydrolase [Candidatus Eisenbacteria bacterium]
MPQSEFVSELKRIDPALDLPLVEKAYRRAIEAHAGQSRKSGDPYHTHAEEVAAILAGLRLDSATVAAGMLHDVIEESDVEVKDIRAEFGEEIAELVDGVTKITGLKFESREREQAENFRKMLLSVVQDVRVILIKLADRLHNMRTISYLSPEQIERISRETRDIYAPLAGRFGMARMQRELDDLAFENLEPAEAARVTELLRATRDERDAFIEEIARPIRERLAAEGVEASISGRAKHHASVHRKMSERGKRFEEIFDLMAVRIITDSVGSCYRALGLVHTLFTPIHDRIKDYIAAPKLNGYRSLHTTVVGPHKHMIEIQIRSREMHEEAEVGIAAHWTYKEGGPGDEELRLRLAWVRQLLEGNIDLTDAGEFLEALKFDLYRDEIFVFTPAGDLKQLPKGSTPIDFAFAIHTDVGAHCAGARVNGRLVSMKHELRSGDAVEIMTSESAHPSMDWLGSVVSSKARSKIRHYLRARADDESVVLGRRIIEREMKRLGVGAKDVSLDDIAQGFGLDGAGQLAAAVGRGDVGPGELERKLKPVQRGRGLVDRLTRRARREDTGVRIEGVGDIMLRFAQCCQPVPGDQIVGIITRGRGISVHRVDCPNTFGPTIDAEHRIGVEWDVAEGQTFPAGFVVKGNLRKAFLADVSKAIVDQGVSVTGASMTTEEGQVVARFVVSVGNLHRLTRLMKTIQSLKGVRSVARRRSVSGPGSGGGGTS